MNDLVPVFGRGGWVSTALLLGLLVGSGITWATLRHVPTKPPMVVYRLSPPPAAAAVFNSSSPAGPISQYDDSDLRETYPAPRTPGGTAPLEYTARDGAGTNPPIDTLEAPVGIALLPEVRISSDRLLRSHPKAGGCLSNALTALAPFTKKGFDLREKIWDGDISLDEGKAVSCQLFKGNEYCFCVGTDAKGSKLSLQLYDRDGAPADAEQSQQSLADGATATACLKCQQTGTYFLIVKLEAASQEKVPWGMLSAYR